MKTRDLFRVGAVVLGGAGLAWSAAGALASSSPGGAAAPAPVAARVVADAADTSSRDSTGAEAAQSRNAARSRMRECGHQWSTMKKNGTASGMTWKDFSQGCLAKQ